MREPDKGPLGTERPGRDFPAPIDFPNECAGTNPDIVEERIAEFTAIHSLDWVAADAGRVRPDDKHADAGMRLCGRIRPRGEPHAVAPICRGPNLFTIDDLIVTIPDGFRSQGREIRAGIRFAAPHAVDAFATKDLGQIPLLPFRSAVDHPGSGLDPHARIGLVAGGGEAAIWPLLVGISRAKEFLMRGSLIEGKEAQRIGFVNYAVPAEGGFAEGHGDHPGTRRRRHVGDTVDKALGQPDTQAKHAHDPGCVDVA